MNMVNKAIELSRRLTLSSTMLYCGVAASVPRRMLSDNELRASEGSVVRHSRDRYAPVANSCTVLVD